MDSWLFWGIAVVLIVTAIAWAISGITIQKVRDAATRNPDRLRNTTSEEALARVADWENTRKRLWPLAFVLVAGLVIADVIASR
jgi:hypothetical protein